MAPVRSAEYEAWANMIQRCTNQNNPGWKYYGGRGIIVCDRWRHSFTDFLEDVGAKPFPWLTLERINNEGNYEPGNVCWATRAQQIANRRITDQRSVGVTQNPSGRWSAKLKRSGVMINLGTFKTAEEAMNARQEMLEKY